MAAPEQQTPTNQAKLLNAGLSVGMYVIDKQQMIPQSKER